MEDDDNPQFNTKHFMSSQQRPATNHTAMGVYGNSTSQGLMSAKAGGTSRPMSQHTLQSTLTNKNLSQQNFNSINRSIAKLETISKLN